MAKKVGDLCDIKEFDSGLAAPSQWNLVSDKQMMKEEQRLQAAGNAGSVNEFVDILLAPFKIGDRGREWDLQCEGLLQQARSLLDPSVPSGKELIDLVGVDLPNVVVQYSGVSKECQEGSTLLIQDLATTFDPAREMFTALCEVINIYSKPETIHLCLPLVRALSLVFPRMKRKTAEFFKVAVPGLLELGRATGQSEADEYSGSSEDIGDDPSNLDRHLLLRVHFGDNIQNQVIHELIHLAKVIKGICDSVQEMERLRDILGIFALQLLEIMSGAIKSDSTNAVPDGELEIMQLLTFSSTTLSSLVSTAEVDKIFDMVFDEEEVQAQENRLQTKRGVALAAFWAIQMDEESTTISGESTGLKEKFEAPGRQTVLDIIGLASTLLSPVSDTLDISFVLKGLGLMTYILELYSASSKNDDASQLDDGLDISIQIRPALQTLQDVIVSIPSPMLRRQSYGVLIKVISEVLPTRARFATLYSLISLSGHPSLVSLLLTCVKDEVHKCWPKNDAMQKLEQNVNKGTTSSLCPFTSREVLQFIQCVLRTKNGEVVELPANLDAVLGALNLYRYLLIKESAGGTNYTHVLSSDELVKGRTYWLLPLREQILRVQDELKSEGTDLCQDVQLAMDYTKDVLYRCLEIVEQLSAKPLM